MLSKILVMTLFQDHIFFALIARPKRTVVNKRTCRQLLRTSVLRIQRYQDHGGTFIFGSLVNNIGLAFPEIVFSLSRREDPEPRLSMATSAITISLSRTSEK